MDMNEKPKLSGVPETMLQTVYARAKETKTRGAIKDSVTACIKSAGDIHHHCAFVFCKILVRKLIETIGAEK